MPTATRPGDARGFVPTPESIVDQMVEKLFHGRPPVPNSVVLDPGCGTGAFIAGVLRWCSARGVPAPRVVGIEQNPDNSAIAGRRFGGLANVVVQTGDFLLPVNDRFDYIVGNPPYVPITELDAGERARYRLQFQAARGRFDLYLLFFEQALRLLAPQGRLVFITPEKFLYVETARALRELLSEQVVEELHFIAENSFPDLTTYPTITTVSRASSVINTRVVGRDGSTKLVPRLSGSASWLPALSGGPRNIAGGCALADITVRVSCGVATGADAAFVARKGDLGAELTPYAYPTIGGRDIGPGKSLPDRQVLLIPYDRTGRLLDIGELGPLRQYLEHPDRRRRLLARTCVRRKPWYSFHENPPLPEILRPKVLCKDIGAHPYFVADERGEIVPRHSVYYIVPRCPELVNPLTAYLNSEPAVAWLHANCQRAANGFVRLQSHVLKRTPIAHEWIQGVDDGFIRSGRTA